MRKWDKEQAKGGCVNLKQCSKPVSGVEKRRRKRRPEKGQKLIHTGGGTVQFSEKKHKGVLSDGVGNGRS